MNQRLIIIVLSSMFFFYSLMVNGQTNYYIDAINGNDANNGMSTSTPWQNLTQLNSLSVTAGSTINLKSGSVWTGQQLKFLGSGSAGNPIIINQYGTGAMPVLNGNGLTTANQGVVYLYNQQYIEINNVEITNTPNPPNNADFFIGLYQSGANNPNPQGADRRGVMIAISGYGTANHIYLQNLNIHHVKGQLGSGSSSVNGAIPKRTGGIYFVVLGTAEQTTSYSRFNDILVNGCMINYCENTGLTFDNEWNVYYPSPSGSEYADWYARRFTNVRISNNIIHHIGKNAMIIRCTDETGLIDHNVCYETAKGTTGNTMFSARAKGTVFQYNEGYYNRATSQLIDPGTIDGSMYDADLGSIGIIFQYSYSHDNSHGLYWGCNTRASANNTSGVPDPGDVGCTARYNISQNDLGDLVYFNYPSAGNEIYNNVFYIPAGAKPNIIHENSSKNHTYNFYNNIVYNLSSASSGAKYALVAGPGVQTRTINYNVFWGASSSTQPTDPNAITSDPLFVAPGAGTIGINTLNGYKIQTGSASIGSGTVMTNNATQDFFGQTLPTYGGTLMPSRGVFEYNAVLPVTLIGFRGEIFNAYNKLLWTTVNETNNLGFELQRCADGITFVDLSFIASQSTNGYSNNKLDYYFNDVATIPGENFYRLKQVDKDGKVVFSPIISLNNSQTIPTTFGSIYPNPVTNQLQITFKTVLTDQISINIINDIGQVVRTVNGGRVAEGNVMVPMATIPSGLYIVQILSGNKQFFLQKVVKE